MGAVLAGLDDPVELDDEEGDAASTAAAMANQRIDFCMPLACVPETNSGSDDS